MSFSPASRRHTARLRTSLMAVLAASCMTVFCSSAVAQAGPTASTPPPELSRFDLYAGYGYINPRNSAIAGVMYQPINQGVVFSAAAYFSPHFGIQAEGSLFPDGPNDCISTAQAGLIFRLQKGRFVPFAHVLGGGAKVGGPVFQPCTWGYGATGGLGVDYILPFFHNHLAVRPIQADYEFSHVDYGTPDPTRVVGGVGDIYGYRLSGGLVLRLGQINAAPPMATGCVVEPANPYPGDPVTVTANTSNLNLHKKTTYTWTSSGGHISGTSEVATVNTSGLAPGDYTVSAHVSQGTRARDQSSCTAGFRIHAFEPPTLTCSASPASILPGESSTITSSAVSPQNRPLTYSYSASAGQIAGVTASVTLATVGVSPSTIVVSCNVVDDAGQQASATTNVIISTPPPPPPPPPVPLCTVSFERDRKRPVRVDNEGKGCLDEVALTLNRESSAQLVIIGQNSADETAEAAAERTLNVEQYLVKEKGIDISRIEVRTRGESGRQVENIMLPPGAVFSPSDSSTFNPDAVPRRGQAYGLTRAEREAKHNQTKPQ